ncbi:MAG TPA: 2-oxo-4-hydroxy-4-carboxy-5-ureidoimidazoline decarboxylase [Candidatus Dormibacteraeota bacterium]|jgi:2-oxo-4-hydroxy-4-carboxy-5-ureidoimidazoline decarboxylase|nr:2-oxo-4-hydroxy-4-carboxy-5-ureidoimidazoline decarboxylase [Candidatus Dormibacteraeota bacterium]
MNEVLTRWNELESAVGACEIRACCGSSAWAAGMVSGRPFREEISLLSAADKIWKSLEEEDWLEAFKSHPKIGGSRASIDPGAGSAGWSEQEQKDVASANDEIKAKLADGNRAYEEKFGFIFIVCATGKSAAEILAILERRLQNGKETELQEAAEEQRQITQLRLKKWLGI